jgi:hypothetical protein
MSDQPRRRSRAWIWWAPLVAVPLYVLSIVPVEIGSAWMARFGLMSPKHRGDFLRTVYAPIVWGMNNSNTVKGAFHQLERFMQPVFPNR